MPDGQPRLVKLVRDNLDALLGDTLVSYRQIEDHETYRQELRKKLVEEATEYLLDPSLAELADVLEIVRHLATMDLGVEWDDVLTQARRKRNERGGYAEGMGMYCTLVNPDGHPSPHG